MPGQAEKTRRRFTWAAVPTPLKRRLLEDKDVDGRVGRASDEELSIWLGERYGQRPKVDRFTSAQLGRPLLKYWVPTLSISQLDGIVIPLRHHVRDSPASMSKRDIVAFLQSRRLTAGYRRILQAVFLRTYTTEVAVGTTASGPAIPNLEDFHGADAPSTLDVYEHQLEAHAALTATISLDRRQTDKGLLVLPTGAGKTATITRWLLANALPTGIRVLWLAHQRELLLQARDAFRSGMFELPKGVSYRSRLMVSGAGGITLLGADDTDIAFLSLPMLATRLDKAKRQRLAHYVSRPTIVVVDEAHHAGADTYHDALTACLDSAPVAMIGLTATPWPRALLSHTRFRELFGTTFFEAKASDLTERGVLAQPVIHTLETDEVYELTADEQRRNDNAPDVTDDVLRRLDSIRRNQLIVDAYLERQELYGKSLVFAANIRHADSLGRAFEQAGVPTRVVHGQSDSSRTTSLEWFNEADGPATIVSVRMLTEGVDLPSARTVILARPTTSRILLRQMIGRALRGPRAGGSAEAHIVNVRDEWTNLPDLLEPPEVLDLPNITIARDRRRPARAGDPWELPEIEDADGQDLPAAVQAEAERTLKENQALVTAAQDSARPGPVRLSISRLAGWYQLSDRSITVFEHQRPGFDALVADADWDLRGVALLSAFDDLPPPYPSLRAVRAFVEHVRAFGPPDFHPFNDRSLPLAVAQQLADGSWTEAQIESHVREAWARGAIRLQMSLLEFEEAVDSERRRLRRRLRAETSGLDPEDVTPKESTRSLPKMRRAERDLDEVMREVVAWMEASVPHLAKHLRPLPRIDWTRRPIGSMWGYWTLRTHGKAKGSTQIRINRLLSTTRTNVTDEMLQYLVYHELLHHVLSTRGHDVGFRNYESKWPDAARLDAEFDTLAERFDTDPASYR